jgi:5-methyltetrahydrofolate--homocysteine methyltransferase
LQAVCEAIAAAVRDGDRRETQRLVRDALTAGVPAVGIVADGLTPGIQALGRLFQDGEAFLPEILISVRAMNAGLDELRPLLDSGTRAAKATVVLGTVEGDLHDIGKNLVGMLLDGNGFNVVDLGVDVSPPAFVAAAERHEACVVALSALLTTTTPQFARVVAAVRDAGLRERVRIMVGGAPVSRRLADEVGADGFAGDCVGAVDEAERLIALLRAD